MPGQPAEAMPENEIFTHDEYREVYPEGIELHFWNLARNDLVYRWLRPHVREGDLVMDVGCGTGLTVAYLAQRGCNARGVEMGDAPVVSGMEHRVTTRCDLFALDGETRGQIRAVLLLDVIEHIADRGQLLQRIYRELPNCRTVLATVPARREIWSSYDEHWGHHLRYDRPQLRAELQAAGFTPQRTAYFFNWLYLVSLLMKLLHIPKSTQFNPIRPGSFNALLHRALGWLTSVENRLVPGAIAGSSLACIAHRADQGPR